ncbi:MAG: carboxyl-terminal protease [Flavobacteriaceae bacterium]|jgi:carboxyl-terminal processing protease|nr:carboxyl-terminal protease [Flavobacteriaceae bacterium]MBT4113296.1 carboxyl-terminal protease [Flavobacteriaceae bacterium]MBT4614703.1 carboxyl-terminal protease [Flavobacteriaceae bacterium]MBT5247099.1 carboxyl-terminal protease [Flavobacteriaceae bacterium]MBT5649755.1 carboxyl-terminal protease [Flavobacteriaceae bacterium]
MKKTYILFFISIILFSCFEDSDDTIVFASNINDFVWKGMNASYLYKQNIEDLANNRFSSSEEYTDFLNLFENPENLFESLIYQRENIDKFSFIVDDYIALQQYLSGISNSNGMEYGLRYAPGSSYDVYGYVRYVHPNTSAEENNIQRGDVFNSINNTSLTIDNYLDLLSSDNYTVNFSNYLDQNTSETSDDQIISNDINIELIKTSYEKNPIHISSIIETPNQSVGYLMFNRFIGDYNDELISVFSNFKSNDISNLILDLRYNPGGSVYTSILLSSLITGQFFGEIISTEQWNDEIQAYYLNHDPEFLINRFIENNSSLNLNRVFIITTQSSASASELVINCLNPYIDVIHIGTNTYGKYQASVTLYDSENFILEGANPNHTYALQPLVLKTLNSEGNTDYFNGLTPDIILEENITNLGVLGDENEPLLALALQQITLDRKIIDLINPVKLIDDSNKFELLQKEMYIDLKNDFLIKNKIINEL